MGTFERWFLFTATGIMLRDKKRITTDLTCERNLGRLQSVPFWSVERVRSQRNETEARRNKREKKTGEEASPQAPSAHSLQFFGLGYFARPLDCPNVALQFTSRKGLFVVYNLGECLNYRRGQELGEREYPN